MHVYIGKYSINIPDTDLGIFLSGGADSAILLYILAKYSKKNIHTYTNKVLSRFGKQPEYTNKIIEACTKLTDNRNITQHIITVEQANNASFSKQFNEVLENTNLSLFVGTTALPPLDAYSEFSSKISDTDYMERDPTKQRSTTYKNGRLCLPFFNLNKKDIANIYEHYELTEILFPLTRSCFIEEHQHCGRCFWCEERKWAFNKI
jgi:7-cyano-7-deazaguanine synthase in queuosine biosynthesis